jgi:hypothetical protein
MFLVFKCEVQKQIPCGDDNQKSNDNSKGEMRGSLHYVAR